VKNFVIDFFETIKRRRSLHSFTTGLVTDKEVKMLLEAARWAPSAGNNQPWRFVVVRRTGIIAKLVEAAEIGYSMDFVRKAPVAIVVCADLNIYKKKSKRWQTLGPGIYCIQDTAAAIENLLLAACALDLGACWVGAFYEDRVKDALKLPSGIKPIAIIPVGRTKSKAKPPSKKPLKELVSYETYGKDDK
jgi:nitroreductase